MKNFMVSIAMMALLAIFAPAFAGGPTNSVAQVNCATCHLDATAAPGATDAIAAAQLAIAAEQAVLDARSVQLTAASSLLAAANDVLRTPDNDTARFGYAVPDEAPLVMPLYLGAAFPDGEAPLVVASPPAIVHDPAPVPEKEWAATRWVKSRMWEAYHWLR